jgi:malonyl-CoA/methylmalonyl-CoA synthetase
LFAVPAIYQRLVGTEGIGGSAFASLRLAISGSAPLSPALFERVGKLLGREPLERYGTTESGLDTSNPYEGDRRPGSVGLPLPGVSMAIANPDGMPLEPGSDGEIVFHGPQVFTGYTDDAETAAAFHPGGWFRRVTSVASIPATGPRDHRPVKEVIITGGLNVTPARWSSRSRPTPG